MVERIDAWLHEHGFDVAGCTDALDACAHLVRNASQPAQLAFVGADWFTADDYALIGYVREAWPRAGIVVYGQALEPQPFGAPDMCVYCASRSALRHLLDKSPEGLLRQLRQLAPAHAERAVQPGVALPVDELGLADVTEPRPNAAPPKPAAAPLPQPDDATNVRSPGGLLTPEELAALLNDQ